MVVKKEYDMRLRVAHHIICVYFLRDCIYKIYLLIILTRDVKTAVVMVYISK